VHIITGKTDEEQWGDGDFSPKAERYRRAAEYLELMKLTWSSERSFEFVGEFYRVSGAASDVRPLQQPHPLLFFGGASEGALSMGAKLCDVYAIYAEPLASTRAYHPFSVDGGRLRAHTGVQCLGPPDHCSARRRGMGQGQPHSCGHERQERMAAAGGSQGSGRQCRKAVDAHCARPRSPRRARLDGGCPR